MPGSVIPAPGTIRGGQVVHYNAAQLETLWIQAGGPIAAAPEAAAIALAESNGNVHAHNASGASGLWQILGAPPGVSGNVFDPATNAKMAVAKYKQASNSFTPWATFTSGAYRAFLTEAQNAMATVDTGQSTLDQVLQAPSNAVSAVSSAVGSVTGSISNIANLLTSASFWIRLLEMIAGTALLFMGLRSMTGNSNVPDVATIAKIVK